MDEMREIAVLHHPDGHKHSVKSYGFNMMVGLALDRYKRLIAESAEKKEPCPLCEEERKR